MLRSLQDLSICGGPGGADAVFVAEYYTRPYDTRKISMSLAQTVKRELKEVGLVTVYFLVCFGIMLC